MKAELSNGEWALMKVLWESSPRTITQLTAALKDSTGWDKHTVIPTLSRLEAKGAVAYRHNGRAKEYYPLLRQSDASRTETKRFLEKVYNGSLGVMVHAMVDSHALSQEDIQELSAILEKAKEREES